MTSDKNITCQSSTLLGALLNRERDRARRNASARRGDARAAYAAGYQLAGDFFLLAAQVYEDSVGYLEEELRLLGME
jgi:hypothetical protein